jgi:hypothetical protein
VDDDRFVDCYVNLAVLHEMGDTAGTEYMAARDSILSSHGFSDSTFWELKEQLDRDPENLVDIWQDINQKLRAINDSLGATE